MSLRSLMNTTVNVQYVTRTDTRRGGVAEEWTNRYANMPCRIQPMSGRETAMYGSERTAATHKMFCEAAYSGITEQDRVVRGSTMYNVTLVRNIDLMDHHMEVELHELKEAV